MDAWINSVIVLPSAMIFMDFIRQTNCSMPSFTNIVKYNPVGFVTRHLLIGTGIPILNLGRSSEHFRIIVGIPILLKRRILGNRGPGCIGCTKPVLTDTKINSLAPRKFEWNFRLVIYKKVLVINGWGLSCEMALIWMPLDFTDDKSTLVHVMAWCRRATSHYVSQCWPRSLSPYGLTRP